VSAEGKHDDDTAGAGGDREGQRIEGLLLEGSANLFLFGHGCGGLHLFGVRLRVLLIQERPSHGGDDKAAGDLDDGEGDAEEGEDGGTDEVDDGEEEDGVDGDSASERAID